MSEFKGVEFALYSFDSSTLRLRIAHFISSHFIYVIRSNVQYFKKEIQSR